jgi:hypothetical protein
MVLRRLSILVVVAVLVPNLGLGAEAFVTPPVPVHSVYSNGTTGRATHVHGTEIALDVQSNEESLGISKQGQQQADDVSQYTSRRAFLDSSLAMTSSGVFLLVGNKPAVAAAPSQQEVDQANIVKGYKRLQYLLDNWEKETTVCKIGGDSLEVRCERTPLKVMDYLGYRATDDPLFRAEKTLRRLYVLAPPDRDVDYFEAVERYAESADEASGMAYISSWGEANPGGGKDRVELFIERARNNVVMAHESLGTVIEILGLKL